MVLPPRGDGPVEQEHGDPSADGVVQGVHHGGRVEGLDDQAGDSAAGGRADRAGLLLGREGHARLGLSPSEDRPDPPHLAAEGLLEVDAIGVRRSGQDELDDRRGPARRLFSDLADAAVDDVAGSAGRS